MKTDRQRKAELKRLAALTDEQIDFSDIPEQLDWNGAVTGKFYRPVKRQVTLRIDADVLAWFKAQGGKYQTAMNKALREHVMERSKRPRRASRNLG
jgi:uncharacterized protein (DUF4415 family)